MRFESWKKISASVLVIAVGGFILFILAFLLAALTARAFEFLAGMVSGEGSAPIDQMWWKVAYVLAVALLSYGIFRSKLNDLVKAAYLPMLLMVLFVFGGAVLYGQPTWVLLSLESAVVLLVALYLYYKKQPWQFYFALAYAAVLAAYIALAGVEI